MIQLLLSYSRTKNQGEVQEMQSAHLIIDSFTITDVHEYICSTRMERQGACGREVEIVTISHMLDTPIYIYEQEIARWVVSKPN